MRRTDDRADLRETDLTDEVGAPLGDLKRNVLPERQAVRELDVLDVATGVRGLHDHEDAGAVSPRRGEVRLDRLAPEPRVDGERVRTRRTALEVRIGVRTRGRPDVATLAVRDHQQAGASGVRAHLFERRHPGGALRLEEGELRLHRDGVRRDGIDDRAAEPRHVASQLDRHQIGDRVEADDELRALALDLGGQAVGEGQRGDGHPGDTVASKTEGGRGRLPSSTRLRAAGRAS